MPKVLFTTPVLEHPARGGPVLRIENSIKALSQISDLYIFSRISLNSLGGKEGLAFYRRYCREFYFAPFVGPAARYARFVKNKLNSLSSLVLKRSVFPDDRESEKDYQALLRLADTIRADVIWLGYGNISYPVLKYIKSHSDYKVVVDTDSVWSRFVLRGLPYARDSEERRRIEARGREKAEEERWGAEMADITTAVSDVDADYYRGLAKQVLQIHIFSNVIDIETYQNPPPPAENLKKPCIYLAGTFGPRSPMEDAARWVITEVWPLLRKQLPDIHFYIVGKGSKQTLSDVNDPGITVAGEQTSVLPYLCHADVALVPLRFESGTRFKILEAGACGIPVVSTTLGAEGIPVTHRKDILIADEPETFASSIVNLITNRNLAAEISNNLRALVHSKYSLASLVEEGRAILEALSNEGDSTRITGASGRRA